MIPIASGIKFGGKGKKKSKAKKSVQQPAVSLAKAKKTSIMPYVIIGGLVLMTGVVILISNRSSASDEKKEKIDAPI